MRTNVNEVLRFKPSQFYQWNWLGLLCCFSCFFPLPIYSTHFDHYFSVIVTGAWRWAIAEFPWWPCYWGDYCLPLLEPLQHILHYTIIEEELSPYLCLSYKDDIVINFCLWVSCNLVLTICLQLDIKGNLKG